jgi:electron transfer flavoprotein beta subunit
MLAANLDLAVITNLVDIEVADGIVKAKQETESGYNVIETATPCVVTVNKPNYEPRYPTIKSKMAARKIPIGELTIGDVAAAAATVVANAEPPKKAAGVKIQEEAIADSMAKAIAIMKEAKVF